MKIQEFRDKTTEELNTELREKKSDLFHLRFKHAINQLDNPQKIPEARRDIARIMTVIRERELEVDKQAN